MAPVLSASAWVMVARGVVGPRIDTGEESCPAPTGPTRPRKVVLQLAHHRFNRNRVGAAVF